MSNPYEFIIVEKDPPIATVRLNRPQVLNALSRPLIGELVDALQTLDHDDDVRAIVLTGSDKAFAAGADISGLVESTVAEQVELDQFSVWDQIRKVKKPLIAAVSGYALGGGNEIAMMCDMIVASETARFGQPEINLGVIPGAGGTQRLAQALGKARAMEIILTGRPITAQEALQGGLVNRVVPLESYLQEAQALAREIGAKAPVAARLGKEAVNAVFDTYLDQGLWTERRNFYLLFATDDQKEGMRAFLARRKPEWQGH
jgi:enoyl-CoA hydratase